MGTVTIVTTVTNDDRFGTSRRLLPRRGNFIRTSIAAATVVLFLLPAAAVAAECNDSSTQSDLDICADQDFKASDAKLNKAYKEIVARLANDPAATKLLVEAEKNWIAFRDTECAFQASASVDGSIYPMLVAECRDTLTQARTGELGAYLNCEEGDTLCPVPSAE